MKNIFFYPTDIGKIGIAASGDNITDLYWEGEQLPPDAIIYETDILKEAGRQLHDYFAGRLRYFTLPVAPRGTEFMTRVWKSLQTIPYGETRSYKQIANDIGNDKAVRAVGQANHRNPIPIIIPCHRVIGADGKLTGYGGGLEIKQYLLGLENNVFSSN
ncbi:MAG: methylated-DNA--[protein]-cysteine S-methyltransferase [Syntrophomonas sp.]|nr:methylated-DNA--[protein]-cysteine S-methyltransferase [Syntrophomonas sp.]